MTILYALCFSCSPCHNVGCYNYNSKWPYYIVMFNKYLWQDNAACYVTCLQEFSSPGRVHLFFWNKTNYMKAFPLNFVTIQKVLLAECRLFYVM